MTASFVVTSSPATCLLDVKLVGLFEADDLLRLGARLGEEISRMRCAPGEHRALYDIGGCKIQHQATVRRLRKLSDRRGQVAKRIAVVTGSSLMKMQLHRILGDERAAACFEDRQSAMAWLLNPHIPSPVSRHRTSTIRSVSVAAAPGMVAIGPVREPLPFDCAGPNIIAGGLKR